MSTANASPNPQSSLPSLASTARALFVGLFWSALMLLVFGLWMRSKYEGRAPIVTPIFFAAGVVALLLAVWQAFTLWIAKQPAEQKVSTLLGQQRLFSYVFLGGGLGLIVMAFALGVAKKSGGSYGFVLDNFAETVGALLFGLFSLAAGYVLQLPREENISPMQFLVDKVPMLKLSQVVLAAICLVAFVYLGFVKKIGFDWFPELAALIFMSMLCVSCFFWLNSGNLDEFGVRIFVLLFGGFTGLILFFQSIGRAIFWRQDIFLGGIVAWQGENAWHFWLCAYVFFFSLVLMAVSFNLARADIRTNVVLRRIMYGYDAIVQTLLVVGILAVFNVVVYAMVPFTYDWTKGRGVYDLSQSTKNLVGGLKKDVNIVVLLPQTTWVYKDTRNLLDNMQALSNRLKIKYISPDSDFIEYQRLAAIFKQIVPDQRFGGGGRGILIVNGPIPEQPKDEQTLLYAFVPERKLFEFDRAGGQMKDGKNKNFFKGEAEILKELKFLLQDRQKRKIYILQGDDEPNFADDRSGIDRGFDFRMGFKQVGIGIFADKLRKDNYEVFGLTFQPELAPDPKSPTPATPNLVHAKAEDGGKKKDIPKDCKTLIVAGVSRTLPPDTLEAIERYMDAGGKMLVFLDVIANDNFTKLKDTGLEPLLKRFGVEVTDQFALSAIVRDPRSEDARELEAETPINSNHPLPKQFADKYIYLQRSARILKPVEPAQRYKAESIMEMYPFTKTNARPSINFKEVAILANPQQNMWKLVTGDERLFMSLVNKAPAVVGVASTDSNGDKPSLVVFGDTEFITNFEMVRSKSAPVNYTLVAGALDWLAEREPGGAPPRENSAYSITLPEDKLWRMILLPGWLMLLGIVGLGIGIWVARRR